MHGCSFLPFYLDDQVRDLSEARKSGRGLQLTIVLLLSLVDLEELDLELEGGAGGDDRGETSLAVGCRLSVPWYSRQGRIGLTVVGGADEVGLLAERELGNALVPALDDSATPWTVSSDSRRTYARRAYDLGDEGRSSVSDESNLEPSRRVPTSS